jgi:type IV secretion system protein TrbE
MNQPLFIAKTDDNGVFFFPLNVNGVGNWLVLGPTGAGKTFFVIFAAAQFQKFPGARVFVFDKGYGAFCPTVLMEDGAHFDLGNDSVLSFQPLASIDEESERSWAVSWLIDILEQENINAASETQKELWDALTILSFAPKSQRTISGLISLVQDESVRSALHNYSIGGHIGSLLDCDFETLEFSRWSTFEMSHLMTDYPKAFRPVISYLFHCLERMFTGEPTVIFIDEGHFFISNPIFARILVTWLKTNRKKNVSIWLSLHNVADLVQSPIADTLKDSFPIRIFLPNPKLNDAATRKQYLEFGLDEKQIDIIANAIPQKQYYVQTDLGNRLIDLGIEQGSATWAICGSNSKQDIAMMKNLREQFPDNDALVRAFLKYKGVQPSKR